MGVTGLWRLIEPSGTLVPLQTLDNKVLAFFLTLLLRCLDLVASSNQGISKCTRGHLTECSPFRNLSSNLQAAVLRDQTCCDFRWWRTTIKATNHLSALLKHTAISSILSDESKTSLTIKPVKEHAEDIYHLPPTNLETSISSEEDETPTSLDSSPTKHWDLHTIDEKSAQFKALPVDVRHDILTDLKETRKQSSWGRLHELPKQSDDFSGFQMKRLLKRYSVQVTLEEVEKEMGGRSLSLAELESLLKDQGVVINDDSVGKRIASDESKRYLLIKDLKKAMDEAKQQQEILKVIDEAESEEILDEVEAKETANDDNGQKKSDIEFENDLKLAIELSLQDAPSTSNQTKEIQKKKLHELSFPQDFERDDF
ncbi:hypothetical protein FQR65_LT01259 [Abscondita terminalis]|nr:hypothetical protein FQR65_LT01259 [Abscondita terminalis]